MAHALMPVLRLDFEEGLGGTAHDSSGNGLDATLSLSTPPPVWSDDTFDKTASKSSLQFGLTTSGGYPENQYPQGSYVVTEDLPDGSLSGNFTVSEWIKTADSVYSQMYTVTGETFRLGLDEQLGGVIAFMISDGVNAFEGVCGSGSVNDGRWHQIAGVFDRHTGIFTCYVDGRLSGTRSFTGPATNTGVDMPYVNGAYYAYSSSYHGALPGLVRAGNTCCHVFVGSLDDVRIYNTDLSGVSIRSLYDDTKAAKLAKE